jgi:ubiquinone/menaquinone biosynthesis C-methylase UbiE
METWKNQIPVGKNISEALAHATDPDVLSHFPDFVRCPPSLEIGAGLQLWFKTLRLAAKIFIRLALRPRREETGSLDPAEVDRVYNREAADYDWKHHLTTRGQDTNWRRMAGWLVVSAPEPCPAVLDLCTGTGLTILEMRRVLREHGCQAEITGLDYNEAMLRRARARFAGTIDDGPRVTLVRGDATALLNPTSSDFATFDAATFDVVTQVFGIGGINDPLAVFESVLSVLRERGRFLLIDMHRPIPNLSGEWFLFGTWLKTPRLEAYSYRHTTLPLVLARLWGWRDTTLDFYLAPLVCHICDGIHYGFRVLWKAFEAERWWLALPLMPTCRIVLEKIRIDPAEYERRQRILSLVAAGS